MKIWVKKDKKGNLWAKIPANEIPSSTEIDNDFWKLLKPKDKVFEVGCGQGRIIFKCLKRKLDVTGIDINKNGVRFLKPKLKGLAEIKYGDILDIKKKEKFKAVLLQGVLSTIRKKNRVKCLKNVRNLLDDKGYVHISEFIFNEADLEKYKNHFKKTKEFGTVMIYNKDKTKPLGEGHCFKVDELVDLIRKSDMAVISIKKKMFMSLHGKEKKAVMIIAQKV
jgi:cyclopropane fatty-acyl-phospholipid synthase-like methyltransferase